jgi:hypothetical protein
MARSYGRLLTSLCSDDEFQARTASAQWIYFWALAQPHVSMCGVVAYTERRWARLAGNATADTVRNALSELEEHRYLMVDETTDEVFIRSFVANDGGILKTPNLLRAMVSDFSGILSRRLRAAFLWEWHTKLAPRVEPDLEKRQWHAAMDALKTLPPAPVDNPWGKGSATPLGTPKAMGQRARAGAQTALPEALPQRTPHPTPSGTPSATTSDTSGGSDTSGNPAGDTTARRVLDRVIGDAPPDVHRRLKAGLNGHHHTAAANALAAGWQPAVLVAALSGRWQGVHDPPKALLARLRGIGPAPPDTTPPPFDPAIDVAPLAEASDPETTVEQLAAIRRQLNPTEQDTP